MQRKTIPLIIGAGVGLAAGIAIKALKSEDNMEGDVVLITGGSRGLGFLLAREFSKLRCRIAICARDHDELDRARQLLERDGAEVFAVVCDVSNEASVREMISAVRDRFGRIDTLINNAGVITVAPVENVSLQDFETAMATMFWGVVYPTLNVLPEMIGRRQGRIAMITSIGGKLSVPHLLPYSCAKFAAVAFSEGLRAEMSRRGISVTTIAPGLMRTGSYLKANFKGSQTREATWFSLSSTMPGVSMSAERAARQIVSAIRRKKAEKILSTPATLAARFHGIAPGLITNILAFVNRLLPGPANNESTVSGEEITRTRGEWFQKATVLGRRAAERLNELQPYGL